MIPEPRRPARPSPVRAARDLWVAVWLSATALPGYAGAADVAGHWEGAVVRNNSVQTVNLDVVRNPDGSLGGTYDIPDLLLYGEPLKDSSFEPPVFKFHFRYGLFTTRLLEERMELTGENKEWGPPVAIHLKRVTKPAPAYVAHEVRFANGSVQLAGTLYVPTSAGRHAAVAFIHGSGPGSRERFEYRGLGPMLATRGIAALVYDKRGSGQSSGSWEQATFDDLAGDATAAAELLARRSEIDPNRVGLLGTSQGGWVAPLAATRSRAVRFLILDKGAAVTVEEQELDRVEYSMREAGYSPQEIADALAYTRAVFRTAYDGTGRDSLDARTARVRPAKWADQVQLAANDADLEGWKLQRYDPAPVLRKTRVPVLAIFGQNDTMVPPAENLARMREYLGAAGNDDVTITVLAGEGHNRYLGAGLHGGKWEWPDAFWTWDKVSPAYQETVLGWIAHLSSPGKRGSGSNSASR